MTGASEVVHVAWGAARADSVRQALRMQGRAERVIALTHVLDVGPIEPFDPEARRIWFAENTRPDDEPDEVPTDPESPWAEATDPGVFPVCWVCPTDAAEHACFLRFVTRMAGRPFDVVEVIGSDFPRPGAASPVWSLGQLRPEEIVAADLGGRRRPFTEAENEAATARWAKLRRENAPLRIVRDGYLVSASLTHFDDVLTGFATGEWELLIKLVARVLGHLDDGSDQPGQGCSYKLLFARILALGQAGALEVSGPGPGMRDFKVRRVADR
ncbi:DUF3658 domain-containing protein [Methylobacterium ajmalii]|uniref:DUF3658 domain-containing protein n=1 Tax=Methylobacterium ajmalii TaxID=2738439 RepID=A0ABV0A212_9HYPH